ncbi:Hsp20/alpha crystallin family protein [Halalkalibacter krulwichiae]|uniref:Hsp20/alpha crystallin family protein n=1 Tax=Halalkalibacter krulwichiae TaxID=199441 RepID=A0A1X9MHU0_9BACI|nr:Hsp20/alpha crystallin family protein [Halalkalibacter krulwichiae]ARK30062.1 Hsp20/alpha crystallin family protein [Halalkalibacter krulwichiae]
MNDFFNDVPKPFKKFFGEDFWGNFDHMFQEFESQKKSQFPKTNIYESGNELICLLLLPGIERMDDINLNVNSNILSVSGTIHLPFESYHSNKEEIFAGSFKRDIQLPFPVRSDKVIASYKRGFLKVYLYRLLVKSSQSSIVIEDLEKE